MSDNIIPGPKSWMENARHSLEATSAPDAVPDPPVAGGGGSPHDPGMEALIARVDGFEKRMDRIEGRLDRVDDRLGSLERKLAEIDGKLSVIVTQIGSLDARLGQLVNKLPSWWQMPAVIGSTVALLVLLYSLVEYMHAAGRL
jgi:hypothetical protein